MGLRYSSSPFLLVSRRIYLSNRFCELLSQDDPISHPHFLTCLSWFLSGLSLKKTKLLPALYPFCDRFQLLLLPVWVRLIFWFISQWFPLILLNPFHCSDSACQIAKKFGFSLNPIALSLLPSLTMFVYQGHMLELWNCMFCTTVLGLIFSWLGLAYPDDIGYKCMNIHFSPCWQAAIYSQRLRS